MLVRTSLWILTALSLTATAAAQTVMPDGWPAPAPDDVFMPGTPEVVTGASPFYTSWSPDGRYAIAARLSFASPLTATLDAEYGSPESTWSISVWSGATHRGTIAWSQKAPATKGGASPARFQVDEPLWLPGSHVAFFTVDGPSDGSRTLWRVDARRGAAQQVATLEGLEQLTVSPVRPAAFLTGVDLQGDYLKPVSATGAVGPPIYLGPAASTGVSQWSADGTVLYRVHLESRRPADMMDNPKGPPAADQPDMPNGAPPTPSVTPPAPDRITYAYDVRTGKTARLASWQGNATSPPAARYLEVVSGDATLQREGTKMSVHPLWLQSGKGKDTVRFPITANGSGAQVSPRSDAVLYSTPEGAFVLPLARMPRLVYERGRERSEVSRLLNNARQIGLALIAWARENGDVFPGQGTDLLALLGSLVRNSSVFEGIGGGANGFRYTYPGGPVKDIKDPANTELGYFDSPSGHVIVFSDGSVRVKKPSG